MLSYRSVERTIYWENNTRTDQPTGIQYTQVDDSYNYPVVRVPSDNYLLWYIFFSSFLVGVSFFLPTFSSTHVYVPVCACMPVCRCPCMRSMWSTLGSRVSLRFSRGTRARSRGKSGNRSTSRCGRTKHIGARASAAGVELSYKIAVRCGAARCGATRCGAVRRGVVVLRVNRGSVVQGERHGHSGGSLKPSDLCLGILALLVTAQIIYLSLLVCLRLSLIYTGIYYIYILYIYIIYIIPGTFFLRCDRITASNPGSCHHFDCCCCRTVYFVRKYWPYGRYNGTRKY